MPYIRYHPWNAKYKGNRQKSPPTCMHTSEPNSRPVNAVLVLLYGAGRVREVFVSAFVVKEHRPVPTYLKLLPVANL